MSAAPPSLLVFAGIISVQVGAGLAGRMFIELGPAGVTALRLGWAAIIMALIGGRGAAAAVRSAIADHAWRDLLVALVFGLVLGIMNFSIYQAFARIPLGVAVTIEFLGPLAVAIASSRRLLDLAWVIMAAAGVLLLTKNDTAVPSGPAGSHTSGPLAGLSTHATGIAFALIAATSWAAYILLTRATGRRFSGSSGLVIAMIVAAVLVAAPAGVTTGSAVFRPPVVAEGLAIGLLSSVIPYRLELEALRRVPTGVFGIWMSLEPVVAALVGIVLLSETLVLRQWLAIALVVVACAGASRGDQPPRQQVPPPPGG